MDSHHPCAAPDRRRGDAGPAGHAESMRDHAGKRGKPAALGNPDTGDARRELRDNVNTSKNNRISAKRRPGEASASKTQGDQVQQPSQESDKELAHRAALRRLNGSKSSRSTDSASTASSQPVLVRAYSGPSPSSTKDSEMRRKRQSVSNDPSSALPSLSSFSFQDILKEIDTEINPAVDAIAEIFGRSKLSLADEYSSHLPPQGELTFPATHDQNEVLESIPNARLETVEEAPKGHSRRQSLALVGDSAQQKGEASMATSAASVESAMKGNPQEMNLSSTDVKASLLPYVISWLKGSNGGVETRSRLSATDPRAAETLQKILGEI